MFERPRMDPNEWRHRRLTWLASLRCRLPSWPSGV